MFVSPSWLAQEVSLFFFSIFSLFINSKTWLAVAVAVAVLLKLKKKFIHDLEEKSLLHINPSYNN